MLSSIRKMFSAFWRDDSGVSILVFALTLPMMMAAAGVTVDLAVAYNVKVRLNNALDKATLAAGTTTGDVDEVKAQILRFVEANFPDSRLGRTFDVEADVGDVSILVTASAEVDTYFMRIFGRDSITVSGESEVMRQLSGVEAVLVLDVTGSMKNNNIAALKAATETFMDVMFKRINDRDYLRIGIVPFSNSVNVGPAGLNEGFVSRPASDPYISPASNIQYSATTGTTTQWKGCILENPTDGSDVTDEWDKNWQMYRWPRTCARYDRWGTCTSWNSADPNSQCPNLRIVPLTNNEDTLKATVKELENKNVAGNTYGNIGMVWGWRVISPEGPFTQGSPYGDPDWSKAVIMMTDGDNTMHPTYSVYGPTSSHYLDADDLDDRFAQTCENMKAVGIAVYTITFQSAISNATRQIFRTCATSPDHYFNAPTNDALKAAFHRIANQLSQLHLSK